MTNHQSNTHSDVQKRQENLRKAAHLQFDFQKAWNAYLADKTPQNARNTIIKGEELLALQKDLNGSNGGPLSPTSVTLRIDTAKETLNKTEEVTIKTDSSPFSYKVLKDGTRVWKIS